MAGEAYMTPSRGRVSSLDFRQVRIGDRDAVNGARDAPAASPPGALGVHAVRASASRHRYVKLLSSSEPRKKLFASLAWQGNRSSLRPSRAPGVTDDHSNQLRPSASRG